MGQPNADSCSRSLLALMTISEQVWCQHGQRIGNKGLAAIVLQGLVDAAQSRRCSARKNNTAPSCGVVLRLINRHDKRAVWRFVKNNDSVLLEAMASLENELPGYQKRPEQIEFMMTVASALGQPGVTVIEAGTGIGKSLGYLIPLLCDARHFTIATGTRVLQTQLLDQSVPVARAATGDPAPIQLRMGRDNYVCPRNLSDALERPGRQETSAVLQVLSDIDEWYRQHRHGMLWQIPEQIALESVRDRVTCSSQDCAGRQCPFFDRCPYFVSRMDRQRGSIVNHHLLIAETLGQSETVSRRDEPEILLIDEAHLLVERLERFASQSLTSERFRALVYRMDRAAEEEAEISSNTVNYDKWQSVCLGCSLPVSNRQALTGPVGNGSEDQLALQFEEIEFVLEQMLEELRALIDSGQWVADIIVNVQALIDHVLNRAGPIGQSKDLA